MDVPSLVDVVRDVGLPSDVGGKPTGPDAVELDVGAPWVAESCEENADCDPGLVCVRFAEGKLCTPTCLRDCPTGWSCRSAPVGGGQLMFVCHPPGSTLCQACTDDAQCAGGSCRELDGELRCTRPCESQSCPDGFTCGETDGADGARECVPVSGSCSCLPANLDEERLCEVVGDQGTCLGLERCDPEQGWLGCTAAVPADESCNGVDDDCDGVADEDLVPPAEPCRAEGPAGVCEAEWTCRGAEGWVCPAPEPTAETCDYRDNDCDGETDEDFRDPETLSYVDPENCGVCGNDCTGRFPEATATCSGEEGAPACVIESCAPGFYRAGPYACAPLVDNLCAPCNDDAVCGGPRDLCLDIDGMQVCGRDCEAGNLHGGDCPEGWTCEETVRGAMQCVPSSGSCDCRLPEHVGATRGCVRENAAGICGGLQRCEGAAGWSDCSASVPTEEICNGVDDDCDGQRDELLSPPAEPCAVENEHGVCGGSWSCRDTGTLTEWVCDAATPEAETCDYEDQDCDGDADEEFRAFPSGKYVHPDHCGLCGYACSAAIPYAAETACELVGGVPTCRVGACQDGHFQPAGLDICVPFGPASACSPCSEDADCAAIGGACVELDGGRFCAAPCESGACDEGFVCEAQQGELLCVPGTGSCACYQDVHAGQPRPCFRANDVGVCTGFETCALDSGWSACSAQEPTAEICNGLDDDCDGARDEGVLPPTEGCELANEHGTCVGAWHCQTAEGATDWRCDARIPGAETCDGEDEDCDGAVDEDFRDGSGGPYVHDLHCGDCGQSCVGFVPFAEQTRCGLVGGQPRCQVVSCQDGYYQPEGFELCVPVSGASDCTPCGDDSQCGILPGACIELDDGSYCARDCATSEDCPPSFVCSDGQCIPPSGSCSCLPGGEDAVRTCTHANTFGVCVGQQRCDPASGWTACSASVPAAERCNGRDDDCDGELDEPGSLDCRPYFRDQDGDGFGRSDDVLCLCAPGLGHEAEVGGDCDDDDPDVHPDAEERCNGVDDNCVGGVDEDDAIGCQPRFRDEDRDGHGADGESRCLCAAVSPWDAAVAGDCDDAAAPINPDAPEVCNGVDDDCDGVVDGEGSHGCEVWWADADADGWGDGRDGACLCAPDLAHSAARSGDCDDDDGNANPDAEEVCGGADEDCDGVTDEEDAADCRPFWSDRDEDGFGVTGSQRCLCASGILHTAPAGGDCDDQDPDVYPGAVESCTTAADCCAATAVCVRGVCRSSAPGPCTTSDDCRDDTFCDGGECVPYLAPPSVDFSASCEEERLPTTLLPDIQCRWGGPPPGDPFPLHAQVLGQVAVADLDLDLDSETTAPSLVFVAHNVAGTDTAPGPGAGPGVDASSEFGVLRVVDGAACTPQAVVGDVPLVGASSPALVDLDADGRVDIVALSAAGGLVAFRNTGGQPVLELLWESRAADGTPSTPVFEIPRWSGPTATDVDGDGVPEVLLGAVVYSHEGVLLADNLGHASVGRGRSPLVADVDLDGAPELVLGSGIFRWAAAGAGGSWQRESYSAVTADGYVAVADFGSYSVSGLPSTIPEVVVVAGGAVRVQRLSGATVFGPITLPFAEPASDPGSGGPPVVGDFDGDGRPEIGVSGAGAFTVFDLDCVGSPAPFGCHASGILWTAAMQDVSSSSSTATLFDFQADGLVEVVVNGECFYRIFRGTDGHILYAHARSSGTFLDGPVVADADGDGHAEIVLSENESSGWIGCSDVDPTFQGLHCRRNGDCLSGVCSQGHCRCDVDSDCGAEGEWACRTPHPNTPGTEPVCLAAGAQRQAGVVVYRDRDDLWAGTRSIHNQQAYFVTNIREDGSVPDGGESAHGWLSPGGNHFRSNEQGTVPATALPDLTGRPRVAGNCGADGTLVLTVDVCNRGTAPTADAVSVAFYAGPPGAGRVLCATATPGDVAPGACAPVSCELAPAVALPGGGDVTAVVDFALEHDECWERNSDAVFEEVTCVNLP